jgi:hypothetical protein
MDMTLREMLDRINAITQGQQAGIPGQARRIEDGTVRR